MYPLPIILPDRYILQFVGYKEKSCTFAVVYKIQITHEVINDT